MAKPFYEQPILNSPYSLPSRHHALDAEGQPLDLPPVEGRRRSSLVTPVPKAKKQRGRLKQGVLSLGDPRALSTEEQAYNPTPIINEIRSHVETWRGLKNPADWGVTPVTQRLLQHWRSDDFHSVRPFFCQVEAVETTIWLTEVATRQRQYAHIWRHIRGANEEANPELLRLALKMATGAGKTTVMAMLIAWQTLNAARSPGSSSFSKGFLIVTPGITIRDRLRVLLPEDPDAYYAKRELVPADMLMDLGKAKIVLTNYHAFKRRETLEVSKVGRGVLKGWRDEPVLTNETEGAMLSRACGELLSLKNVLVINDEAHHCYREKPGGGDEDPISTEEKEEAKRNAEAARLWISGLEALKRKVGVRTVLDLSATPFFLRGSGYIEGTLFPWTVSDFSLIDAIECGIVKLPRVPVADNLPSGDMPLYRALWEHIGKRLPKKGAGKTSNLDPLSIPAELQTALYALYSHYELVNAAWEQAGISVPPVFIVVCNNTSTSKLVYEWIAGFERPGEDGAAEVKSRGHLAMFRNYDEHYQRLGRPNTLLIDSEQLESGDALDAAFRDMAGPEIEQFKIERRQRLGSGAKEAEEVSDAELLREVMNTVGRKGALGEQIRCVVSVSMLTEGWDANTVTHILGVRAFGTQLLCEQVVGRGLRRQSYELNDQGLFDVEYADILGIPFDFAAEPVVAPPKPPKRTTRVHAIKERAELEIGFPRVDGYRYDFPPERLTASFSEDSRLELTPEIVGPCQVLMEGIVGEGVELNAEDAFRDLRPSTVSQHLAKRLVERRLREPNGDVPWHLFPHAQRVVRQWLDAGYLVCKGVPVGAVTYLELADKAIERIWLACQRSAPGESRIKATLDPYNPRGSTRFVNFTTTKTVWETAPDKCHVNYGVCDSDWEAELARVLERHSRVLGYVKNQGLQFEVPYLDGAVPRRYVPDFIVRLDDGGDDPLNLILETKGYRGGDAQLKAETMKTLWVTGVNNLGDQGRWAFEEFRDVFAIQDEFAILVERLRSQSATSKVAA